MALAVLIFSEGFDYHSSTSSSFSSDDTENCCISSSTATTIADVAKEAAVKYR